MKDRAVSGLPRKGSQFHQRLRCWSSKTATGENQADPAWKADKKALPPGQCTGTQIYSGNGCYPEMWIPICRRPTLFSWIGSLFPKTRKELGGRHIATQKGSGCYMTSGLSVLIQEGTMLKNTYIWFSKTVSFYLRIRTYQSPGTFRPNKICSVLPAHSEQVCHERMFRPNKVCCV